MYIADAVLHKYPETIFGLMRVTGLDTGTDVSAWAALREQEIANFRAQWSGYDRKSAVQRPPLSCYVQYYKRFKKTYLVLLQMESVLLKGRDIRADSPAVEAMFLAEVKHGLCVAGHNTSVLLGEYTLNLAKGGEQFTTVSGETRTLKPDDIFMTDGGSILSSTLEGQDFDSRLTKQSAGALYCVYGVGGVKQAHMHVFFEDLTTYLHTAFPHAVIGDGMVIQAGNK